MTIAVRTKLLVRVATHTPHRAHTITGWGGLPHATYRPVTLHPDDDTRVHDAAVPPSHGVQRPGMDYGPRSDDTCRHGHPAGPNRFVDADGAVRCRACQAAAVRSTRARARRAEAGGPMTATTAPTDQPDQHRQPDQPGEAT